MAVDSPLAVLLRERFAQRGVGATRFAWATALGVDKGTLSRILNGVMPLTENRARDWAKVLFPHDPEGAAAFVAQLLSAPRPVPRTLDRRPLPPADAARSVDDFCKWVVAQGGVVEAERIAELFTATKACQPALICVEYRDGPRAGRTGKYQGLAAYLTDAVAAGVHFAMFQPFDVRVDPPEGVETPSIAVTTYILQMREKCRSISQLYAKRAADACKGREADGARARIRLYESARSGVGTDIGFQSKIFFIQYRGTGGDDKPQTRFKVFQWVSTPDNDFLFYRDPDHLPPEVVRDTFYPVPHYFEVTNELPDDAGEQAHAVVVDFLGGAAGLPTNYQAWRAWREP